MFLRKRPSTLLGNRWYGFVEKNRRQYGVLALCEALEARARVLRCAAPRSQ